MALNQFQKAALEVLKARLDTKDPGHASAQEIRAAFDGPAARYLETWVLPLLDALLRGPERCGADHWQERATRADYAAVTRARDAAKAGQAVPVAGATPPPSREYRAAFDIRDKTGRDF